MAKKITGEDGKTYVEKKPFYKKWWFILLVVLVILGAIAGKKEEGAKPESDQTQNQTSAVKKEAKKEVVYEKTTAKQMISDLEGNAMKAANTYKGKDYEITGVLGNIDAQGAYVTIEPSSDSITITGIQAYVKNDDQKKVITELSKGDKITVKGKIKDVGEVFGYSVDIDEISKSSK